MMMRRQQSQEPPVPLSYHTPDTLTPPELLTSDDMTPEPDCQNTVTHNSSAASPPMLSKQGFAIQGPLLRASSVNETLEQELRSKLCELVGQASETDVLSSHFEPIREAGDRRINSVREKESEMMRPKEMRESRKDKRIDREMNEKINEQQLERQKVREMDASDEMRQITIEREIERHREVEREGERERERQRVKEQQMERDRERQRDIEIQMKRDQERQKKMEPVVRVKSKEKQEVTSVTEEVTGRVTERFERPRSLEVSEFGGQDDVECSVEVKRISLQRSKSETRPEKQEQVKTKTTRSTVTSPESAPCGLEEQMAPSEVSKDRTDLFY